MEIFGLIMLALIAIILQHLSNWLFRIAAEEGDSDGSSVFLSLLCLTASLALFFGCAIYLIEKF